MNIPIFENPVELREWRFECARMLDKDGKEYSYDAIVHMGLVQRTLKRNSVTVKSDGIMTLWFGGGEILEVNTFDRMPRADNKATKLVINLWKVISEATLPQRVKPYIDQYMAEGCFDFGGLAEHSASARFYRGGKVEQGERRANIKTDRYSIGNGFFQAHVPGKTAFGELGGLAGGKDIVVSTTVDGDAFYTLIPIILSS